MKAQGLTIDQRIAFSREIARGFAERDKVLKALGLDFRTSPDAASILYANVTKADTETPDSASESHSKGDE